MTETAVSFSLLGSYVAVGSWIYQAHKNLRTAGFPALEFSPGWAIGWFAVPIANLLKPFQAMSELWNASHGAVGDYSARAPAILWVWWLCWLLGWLGMWESAYDALDLVGICMTIISAATLWIIISTITRQQHTMEVAETFD